MLREPHANLVCTNISCLFAVIQAHAVLHALLPEQQLLCHASPWGHTLELPACCHAEEAVVQLGSGINQPWEQAFVDKTAQWIWTVEGALQNAPSNSMPIQFKKTYHSAMSVPVVIHAYADNYASFTLNGVQLGWAYWGSWGETQFDTTLQAGNNVLTVDAINVDAPAGLLVTVINKNTGAVVLHTDGSWTWQVQTIKS